MSLIFHMQNNLRFNSSISPSKLVLVKLYHKLLYFFEKLEVKLYFLDFKYQVQLLKLLNLLM